MVAGVIGLHGQRLGSCPAGGHSGLVCVDLDRGDPALDVAPTKARPWRTTARAGTLHDAARVQDPRSIDVLRFELAQRQLLTSYSERMAPQRRESIVVPPSVEVLRKELGANLRRFRRAAGLRQEGLADVALVGRSSVSNIEGGRQISTRDFWSRADAAVGAQGALVAAYDNIQKIRRQPFAVGQAASGAVPTSSAPTPGSAMRDRSVREAVDACLPQLRRALDTHDCPEDGPTRPLPALHQAVGRVVRMRLQSNYQQLVATLPELLPELHRAAAVSVGQRRAFAAELLSQTYRAADAVADKFGYFDLSARIIALMAEAARVTGDETAIATAAYVRGETFFASGTFEAGRRFLERSADRLMPEASAPSAAAYGALHMRAAVLAARAGQRSRADDHLGEAECAASRAFEGIYRGTAFGPASVQIHRLTLAVDLHDTAGALKVAAGWRPPPSLPAERRSHFFIDLSRAFVAAGDSRQAFAALISARTIAPEHVREHADVRAIVRDLVVTAPRRLEPLDAFARWTGVSGDLT